MDDKLKLGEKLVHFFASSVTRDEAILKLASLLYDCGYVRDTYATAVIEREKNLPDWPAHSAGWGCHTPHRYRARGYQRDCDWHSLAPGNLSGDGLF